MSVRSFRSVFMVGGVAAAALSCYLVSLRVASERAALESVESEIVLAQRDIRLLQTEIGTRGRLAQLERWNVKVLLLSAPSADQIVGDSFQLARMIRPEQKLDVEAPVVYASAPAPQPQVLPPPGGEREAAPAPTAQLLHEASLKTPARTSPAAPRQVIAPEAKATQAPTANRGSAPEKPSKIKSKESQTIAKAKAPAASSAKAKAVAVKVAQADLPKSAEPAKAPPKLAQKPDSSSTAKDSGKAR